MVPPPDGSVGGTLAQAARDAAKARAERRRTFFAATSCASDLVRPEITACLFALDQEVIRLDKV
jgi:hypothetical protein